MCYQQLFQTAQFCDYTNTIQQICDFVNCYLSNFVFLGEKFMYGKIKRLCVSHKITVPQLEENLGWSRCIYRWDTNTPSVDKVKAVADYFDVTVDYLLEDGYEPYEVGLFDKNLRELIDIASKCSPNEVKTLVRLAKALRGEDFCDAPTSPKID